MTTPAEELRAAAEKLRGLATAASTDKHDRPTARWYFTERGGPGSGGYLYSANPDGPDVKLLRGGSTGAHGRGTYPHMDTRHGEYAAAMDPTVGLLLARWLDSWGVIDLREHTSMQEDARHALAIARAINTGGQP